MTGGDLGRSQLDFFDGIETQYLEDSSCRQNDRLRFRAIAARFLFDRNGTQYLEDSSYVRMTGGDLGRSQLDFLDGIGTQYLDEILPTSE
jgi:hypothetical protein